LPDPSTQALWKTEIYKLWESLLQGIPVLADAVKDPGAAGKDKRVELRRDYIIMRPVVQHAIVIAIKRLLDDGSSLKIILTKLAKLDYRYDNPEWERIAVKPVNKIIAGKSETKLLARLIAYRLGENLSAKELGILENQYVSLFDVQDGNRNLPPRIN
jgi:hypothetical protein